MSKRKYFDDVQYGKRFKNAKQSTENVKKHSLDSDEEDDNDEENNVLHEDDIEGEEDGMSRQEGDIKMTAFNMEEEKELGHFDKQGHFIWTNEKEVRDNWLDNIEWEKITPKKYNLVDDDEMKGLGESDSDNEEEVNEIETYKKIITYMKPNESINKALRRLGGASSKLSSVERLKLKKAGLLNNNKDVTDLTELANKLLTTGNMDIYQETYENIKIIIEKHENKSKPPTLDMYADDFEVSEKKKLNNEGQEGSSKTDTPTELKWFFKWDQNKDDIEGPFDTMQMYKWSKDGYFKSGVWVRKNNEDTNFYSSNRIDFELYL